ncbi:hypothetical protein Lal_00021021 [Lupinus albus]|nr:hypothetical protein Lal_00021021 [Lupinus albus]
MAIVRDIVSDFSDEDEIELCGDNNEEDADVEIGSSELHDNITYATPSSFFTYTNSSDGRDYRPRSTTFTNDNDLSTGMQFESKESTLNAIKQFHIRNSFDYVVVESKPNKYAGRCKHYGAAMSRIYGDWEGSYNDLPRWMNAVQNFAPGTIVRYEVSRHFVGGIEDPTSFILDRVFWAFMPCIKGGTRLLTALRTQLQEWSNAESVYCIRHLASNFNKEFRDPDLKDKVIEMGAWLDNIPKAKWAQCYDEGRRYGHMTTNLAECVNSVLKGSRALSITALFQTTYYRLNLWFVDHRDEAFNMIKAGHIYCEELTNVIKENQRQSTCQLVRSFSRETGVAEVEAPSRFGGRHSKVYTVKLTNSWCDCGEFQSLRLPCFHAIATCSNLNLDCGQFISPIYRLDNILKVYELEFQPIGNEEYWPSYSGPSFIPNPIMRRKRIGRPKTTRIHNEMDEVEPQLIKKCEWCRTEGHNRKTCPYRMSEVGQSSTQPNDNE